MTQRTVFTPHPVDRAIRLIQWRRGASRTIEAEIILPDGSRKIVSTRKQDIGAAFFAALEIKARLYHMAADGGPVLLRKAAKPTGPTFAEASAKVTGELAAREAVERRNFVTEPERVQRTKLVKFRGHRAAIRDHLNPALGHLTYSEITRSVINGLMSAIRVDDGVDPDHDGRRLSKAPSQSTVGSLAHTYGMVMDRLRAMSNAEADYPAISRRGFGRPEPRGSFEPDELRAVLAYMSDDWIEGTPKRRNRLIRRLLRAYVHLSAATGIRAGLEITRLRAGQIVRATHPASKRPYIRISITSNQGKYPKSREAVANGRDPVCSFDAGLADVLRVRGTDTLRPDTILLALPTGEIPAYEQVFRKVLDDAGLYLEPGTKTARSLYSLRHYYANTMISFRTDIYKLAKIMGTSTAMIESYYGKALSRRSHAELAGLHDPVGSLAAAIRRQPVDPHEEEDDADFGGGGEIDYAAP